MLLILSLIPLWLGPVLFSKVKRDSPWVSFLDGFVLVSLIGLILFSIIPESFAGGNAWSVLFFFGGMWLPVLLEDVFKVKETNTHLASFIYVGLGLVLHTAIDGAMLVESPDFSEHHPAEMLSLAVIFHRIPMGFGLWWLVRPHFGTRLVIWLLFAMTSGTLMGYFAWHEIEHIIPRGVSQAFQAVVAGSLLHIIFHNSFQHDHSHECQHDHEAKAFHPLEVVGNILGLLVLVAAVLGHDLVHSHHAEHLDEVGLGALFFTMLSLTAPPVFVIYSVLTKLFKAKPLPRAAKLSRFSALHLFLLILACWGVGLIGDSAHELFEFATELMQTPIWGTLTVVASSILSVAYLYFFLVRGARQYIRQFF